MKFNNQCKICSNKYDQIMSFGKMPIANNFIFSKNFSSEHFFELKVAFCQSCKMFQLMNQPDPKMMFHENYAFFSGTSKNMGEHFKKMADNYLKNFITNHKEAFVVELGSNDGIMLKHFANVGITHLGIEPSSNVAEIATQSGVNTICEFFSNNLAYTIEKQHGKADIITSANVMCHIADLSIVAEGVDILLKEGGIFVFEDPYLGDVIQKASYDQIYDEHVYIFSVQSVINTFSKHGLELFHVEPQITHGGSMRYYLCRKGFYTVRDSVKIQLQFEKDLALDSIETYQKFANACQTKKQQFVDLLKKIKSEGKRVVGYAATAKSTTVLNYCNIDSNLIEYICDTTPLKQGKYSPGMHIPVKPYIDFKNDNPDYAILFAWNHSQEIFDKEQQFLEKGGKWIIFVPEVKVLISQNNLINNELVI